jgi:ribosomal silencing factor RsfS
VESVVSYLEANNLENIIVVPTHKLGYTHLKETSILCSGYTTKHIHKSAKDLVVEIKKLKIPNLPFIPTVFGRRDEEWLLVEIGEIQIHFFVESFRKEFDLLDHWLNPTSDDIKEFIRRADAKVKGKKHL